MVGRLQEAITLQGVLAANLAVHLAPEMLAYDAKNLAGLSVLTKLVGNAARIAMVANSIRHAEARHFWIPSHAADALSHASTPKTQSTYNGATCELHGHLATYIAVAI